LAEHIATHRPTVIADKGYYGHDFEAELTDAGITLLRPARKGERSRSGQRFLKPLDSKIPKPTAHTCDLVFAGHAQRLVWPYRIGSCRTGSARCRPCR
jgi:hypothetical protein